MPIAHAPARTRSTRCRAEADRPARHDTSAGWKMRWLACHSKTAVIDSSRNPGHSTPMRSRNTPSSNGGKNPPRPPSAPTRPVTVPVSRGNRSGTSLNTAPLPRPSSAAQPSAPTVNGIIDGQASNSENPATPPNTHDSTCAPPMRSASQPPADASGSRAPRNPPHEIPHRPGPGRTARAAASASRSRTPRTRQTSESRTRQATRRSARGAARATSRRSLPAAPPRAGCAPAGRRRPPRPAARRRRRETRSAIRTRLAATAPPKTAADWPSRPSPKMPSAVPCIAGGVHRDTNAAPIANDEPASPMKNAAMTSDCVTGASAAPRMPRPPIRSTTA